jgi:hypothetical protein
VSCEADAAAIDAELIRLHRGGAPARLSALHNAAAAILPEAGARRFHLTHAWVFALEAGDENAASDLETALRALGGLR